MRTMYALLAALMVAVVDSEAHPQDACRVCDLGISTGMARAEVEKKIAKLRGTPSAYSPYGNNLKGGLVEYLDRGWVLRVIYKSGSPAPWVVNKNGVAEHWPPIDESVLDLSVSKVSSAKITR